MTVEGSDETGWIVEVEGPPGEASGGPARRFYDLTPSGREALKAEVDSMQDILDYARQREILAGD